MLHIYLGQPTAISVLIPQSKNCSKATVTASAIACKATTVFNKILPHTSGDLTFILTLFLWAWGNHNLSPTMVAHRHHTQTLRVCGVLSLYNPSRRRLRTPLLIRLHPKEQITILGPLNVTEEAILQGLPATNCAVATYNFVHAQLMDWTAVFHLGSIKSGPFPTSTKGVTQGPVNSTLLFRF